MNVNRNTLISFIFFFIKLLSAFNPKEITLEKLDRLKTEYNNFMGLTLNNHLYYANMNGKSRYNFVGCPNAADTERKYSRLFYPNISVDNQNLSTVIDSCKKFPRYDLAYGIILNVIESTALTYIYRFCSFAIEMNERYLNLGYILIQFEELLFSIKLVFEKELISTDPIYCVMDTFNFYHRAFPKNDYGRLYKNYTNKLLMCMNGMEKKLNFIKLDTYNNNFKNIRDHHIKPLQKISLFNGMLFFPPKEHSNKLFLSIPNDNQSNY